mgnify:CR=1 FL=1|jgi:hypothetical protein
MLKKYKVLRDLPLYNAGETITFQVYTNNYDKEYVEEHNIDSVLIFMWDNRDFYLEELKGVDIGDLPLNVYNQLKDAHSVGQFFTYEWSVLYETNENEYIIKGFHLEENAINDIKHNIFQGCEGKLKFWNYFQNKKRVMLNIR